RGIRCCKLTKFVICYSLAQRESWLEGEKNPGDLGNGSRNVQLRWQSLGATDITVSITRYNSLHCQSVSKKPMLDKLSMPRSSPWSRSGNVMPAINPGWPIGKMIA